jgi:hypothetical protein
MLVVLLLSGFSTMSSCSPSISGRPLIQDQSRPSIVKVVCESSNVGLNPLGTRVEEDDLAEATFLEVFFGDVHLIRTSSKRQL